MNKKTLEALTSRMTSLTDSFSKLNDSVGKLDFSNMAANMAKAAMQFQNPPVQGGGGAVAAVQNPAGGGISIDNFFKKPLLGFLESFSGALDGIFGVDASTPEARNKLADSILGMIGPAMTTAAGYAVVTTLVPEAVKLVISEFYSSMKSVTELQTRALATGLKEADILDKFNVDANELRSSIIDMEGELLKLREVGIRGLSGDTTKLADRMLFTNQNVGVLAKFLTSNALAVGLNTEQAQSLAQEIVKLTAGYGASQQAILEAANSIQEISTRVNVLAGTGPELTKAMATYTASFGVENAAMLKDALGFMFNTQNQTFIRAFGFTDQINKVLAGQASPEELLVLIQQISARLESIQPKVVDITQGQILETALKSYGFTPEQRQTFDTLAGTKLLTATKDIYGSTVVFKDVLNGLSNEMAKAAKGIMTGVTSFLGDGKDWKQVRQPITEFFESISELVNSTYIKIGMNYIKSILDKLGPEKYVGGGMFSPQGFPFIEKLLDSTTEFFDSTIKSVKDQFDPEKRVMQQLLKQIDPTATAEDKKLFKEIVDQLKEMNVSIKDQKGRAKVLLDYWIATPYQRKGK